MTETIWKNCRRSFDSQASQLVHLMEEAEAIVVGIGSGMSSATGFVYTGPRFTEAFPDFIAKYHFFDMLQAFIFDGWESPEEEWAFMSRFAALNYFDQPEGLAYTQLKELLEPLNYHVITTNADSTFYRSLYDMNKVFRCQGEYGLIQCSLQCHEQAYPLNKDWNQEMIDRQVGMRIPHDLLPKCPKCGAPMEINKRDAIKDMVEDDDFQRQKVRYESFLKTNDGRKVLFLELGVGKKTPQFIRDPFQEMTMANERALYVTVNPKRYQVASGVKDQTIRLTQAIETLMAEALTYRKELGDATI